MRRKEGSFRGKYYECITHTSTFFPEEVEDWIAESITKLCRFLEKKMRRPKTRDGKRRTLG
jgi:hypothetical protein